MVDTYSKGADSRKLYKKNHGDGEDPIIIAQRFLNIFRPEAGIKVMADDDGLIDENGMPGFYIYSEKAPCQTSN